MRIAFCGHSHHRTTRSSVFMLDLLRERAAVEEHWDESWLTGIELDLDPIVNGSFDAVVVWQMERVAERLAARGTTNVTFFPMYDGCYEMPDAYWRGLSSVKVVCFCAALHERLQRLGVRTRYVRWFPDPSRLPLARPRGGRPAGYLWQRRQEVTWATVRALAGPQRFARFTLHSVVDPSFGEIFRPSEQDAARHGIRFTGWFPSREAMLADLAVHDVYFAPRLREGIGLAFLEAMAMGMLVVAPDRPTMNEYVVSGVNGLLYDPLRPVPVDLSRRAELGARARRAVEHGFAAWSRSVPALLEFVLSPPRAYPVAGRFDALDPMSCEEPPRPSALPAIPRPLGPLEGGRRSRADPRRDDEPGPLVTVGIVTHNAEGALPGTLASVLAQDWPNLEIVVQDSASTDETVDLLRAHDEVIDLWRSAPDGGPYEAMNAVTDAAAGRFVIFMNAGDRFQTCDALSRTMDDAPADADVIFGHHVYRTVEGPEELHLAADFSETWSLLRLGEVGWRWLSRVPGHQATLTRTTLLRELRFRTEYRIAADHDLLYRLARSGARFHHALTVIANCVGGGLSWADRERCLEEWRRIALEYTDRRVEVAHAFDAMLGDMAREELPRLPFWRVVARIGRVRGAGKEASRRVRRSVLRRRLVRSGVAAGGGRSGSWWPRA
jgi:hypothetical protein